MSWETVSESLSKLAAISSMPSDRVLLENGEDLADRYDDIIENISQQIAQEEPGPDEEAELVRVLADSFGLGGGMGVYWGRYI